MEPWNGGVGAGFISVGGIGPSLLDVVRLNRNILLDQCFLLLLEAHSHAWLDFFFLACMQLLFFVHAHTLTNFIVIDAIINITVISE